MSLKLAPHFESDEKVPGRPEKQPRSQDHNLFALLSEAKTAVSQVQTCFSHNFPRSISPTQPPLLTQASWQPRTQSIQTTPPTPAAPPAVPASE